MKIKHVQIEVELSSPELSIMNKGSNQQSVEILPIPFHNILSTDDPINSQLDNTVKHLVALQPTYPLHSVVYPIS